MNRTLPGTVLQVTDTDIAYAEAMLSAMFLAGGISLSQVSAVTGLETYTVQNWVKRGFLTAPKQKKYTKRQLCRIININMLKAALPLEDICGLLQHINGHLDDESDDLIDDSQLYFLFLKLIGNFQLMSTEDGRKQALEQVLEEYREPVPGARERLAQVLRIMLTAWAAAQLRQRAENLVKELKTEKI